jgi:hypothetical protein
MSPGRKRVEHAIVEENIPRDRPIREIINRALIHTEGLVSTRQAMKSLRPMLSGDDSQKTSGE